MRLLLVDDQPLFLEGLQNLLTARGLEVVGTAGDGFEALARARELQPDVILMDIQMPRCGGLEAAKLIKAEMPEVKIVMLTVSGEDEDLLEALASGASSYLLKSLDAEEFFELLARLAGEDAAPSEGVDRLPLSAAGAQIPESGQDGHSYPEVTPRLAPSYPPGSMKGHSVEEMSIYQEIVENGLTATGALFVVLARSDVGSAKVQVKAWAGLGSAPMRKLMAAARAVVPNFDPIQVGVSVDFNPLNRQVYLEGKQVSTGLEEIGEGAVDPRLLRLGVKLGGIHHALVCPLKVGDRIEGSLSFYTSDVLSKAQQRTCEAIALQASLTLENARLVEALQRQLKEVQLSRQQITTADERLRREIAELLHGRVQTKLLVTWHRLGECERLLESDPTRARGLLAEVRNELDQIREQEIRRASHLLHPSIIRIGLLPAVRSLLDSFGESFQSALQVDPRLTRLDDPVKNGVPESLRLTAYRVVEEALNNVFRHAAATTVRVSLEMDGGNQMEIVVEDDGRGFDTAREEPGLGLSSIAGRVDQVGGSWKIASAPGKGTRLSVLLPLGELPGDHSAPSDYQRVPGP